MIRSATLLKLLRLYYDGYDQRDNNADDKTERYETKARRTRATSRIHRLVWHLTPLLNAYQCALLSNANHTVFISRY